MALTIGLTGGIASGKSTVTKMIRELGIPVIDADQIARDVVKMGEEAYNQIIQAFGQEILQEDGEIDRAKLGAIVFHNEQERKKLNAIVHPAVRQRMLAEKEAYVQKGAKTVVLDIPLLFESELTHLVDKTIVVYVDDDVQLERLMKRNGFSKEEALARIQAQMPLREKVKKADAVIDNNGTIEETKQQLWQIFKRWNAL
ncbi:dephospho-CoA kinase [Parageobacillus thermoglucosidasius]|uniref:dephospho-CoA kinase n=1 Tax=Parageobacillus thermoglucosidasius TaxID=1426 RepID=UPI0001D186BD|nr:dephospho-CoA kinase [Parageobacillus thermoglucosidasius]AEH46907.1 Dephospho-CoA kinase [Parageobacillus thermoglucosidasius C56-YS93]MBY6267433.1 dephospho-CoA kinase [Parageobacillus thermoglucosidasius]OUM84006.1 MAG: dephospho-CoA kinase [Parageobacillus thermoglucosidasius]RDE32071.1 dephospho-CoA kinase [Parageobacillus thermoglucosidasius]GMN98332.1 dephospho-CoA kinase [Parageobacillus thermoglucosidasius]